MRKLDQIYKDRLLLVVNALKTHMRFDFNQWVGSDWQGRSDLSCGTTCCGLGLATTIPELRALGLRLHRNPGSNFGYPTVTPVDTLMSASMDEAEGAAKVIFGLDKNEFQFLFLPWEHETYAEADRIVEFENEFGYLPLGEKATAQDLSAHIRRFVEEH